jgi:hypothetical protein
MTYQLLALHFAPHGQFIKPFNVGININRVSGPAPVTEGEYYGNSPGVLPCITELPKSEIQGLRRMETIQRRIESSMPRYILST